ncbi:hypothetical protein BDF20DRAFT_839686 [Mycotypha africana]|uniref:uncharacterized protein n=1 Tax=Mycotypha africana TaxID=64632 RepID=UPI002301A2A0|nr:uncharacterized protein BDF20DRAFT_839686 [Mycotypha africana]KAI8968597.1 hypothetical protein BDF20DRAFT_839686 [Mycotypha africana]
MVTLCLDNSLQILVRRRTERADENTEDIYRLRGRQFAHYQTNDTLLIQESLIETFQTLVSALKSAVPELSTTPMSINIIQETFNFIRLKLHDKRGRQGQKYLADQVHSRFAILELKIDKISKILHLLAGRVNCTVIFFHYSLSLDVQLPETFEEVNSVKKCVTSLDGSSRFNIDLTE